MAKVLLIVDMQKDFMPSMLWSDQEREGALPVADGLNIVPNIVKESYNTDYDLVIATRDFHPQSHSSFKELGGTWPMHCIAGTEGAQILYEIDAVADIIISKGTNPEKDGYSAFEGTALVNIVQPLQKLGEEAPEIVICGVATDYCVKATALYSQALGFRTSVLLDCIAGVDQETTDDALILMDEAGITLRSR